MVKMSLNQKYTWQDFLKEHPEHREKKTKRTSAEGKKAFEAAYKVFVKKYLSEREEKTAKIVSKTAEKKKALIAKSTEYRKAGNTIKTATAVRKIGAMDAAIARNEKLIERSKTLQKNFK